MIFIEKRNPVANLILTKAQLIREVRNVHENWEREPWEVFDEYYRDELMSIVRDVENGVQHERWNKLNFPRLKKIWEDYMRYGFVRDTKGMEEIKWLCIQNIAKLQANTQLVGHTIDQPENIIHELGYYFKEPEPEPDPNAPEKEPVDPRQYKLKYRDQSGKFWSAYPPKEPKQDIRHNYGDEQLSLTKEEFFNRLYDYIGDDTYSDYALDPLLRLANELIQAQKPEEELLICDRIFNVVHMRGDIAELFIDGGSRTLTQLSGEHSKEVIAPEGTFRSKYVNEAYSRAALVQEVSHYIDATLGEFARNMQGKQVWEVVPFDMWARVRNEFFKYGFVRSHNALNNVISVLTHNVLQLAANTVIAHIYGDENLSMWGGTNGFNESAYAGIVQNALLKYDLNEEDLPLFWEYIQDDKGIARITDTALGKLYSNIEDVHEPQEDETKVVTVDHIFDIAHPRNDLSSWLIEGGSNSLTKLSSQ